MKELTNLELFELEIVPDERFQRLVREHINLRAAYEIAADKEIRLRERLEKERVDAVELLDALNRVVMILHDGADSDDFVIDIALAAINKVGAKDPRV